MTPEEMIANLNEYGGDAGSTFNDGDLMGWFGWSISGNILTVTFEHMPGIQPEPKQAASWRLIPQVDP